MKIKTLLITVISCGLSPFASAFTLDFTGLTVGDPLPLSMNVPGYGTVEFASVVGTQEVGVFSPPAGTNAIAFDNGESITVTFTGATPDIVQGQFIGVNAGIDSFTTAQLSPTVFLFSFSSTDPNGTAGLQSVLFTVPPIPPTTPIPEPTAALLGAIGAAFLVIRRRR